MRPTEPWRRWLVIALGLANVLLLAWALAVGAGEVRDGAGSVTTGMNVALAIAGTLAAVLALQLLRMPASLRASMQIFGLVAQALHTLGHLARWYYTYPWYDDALHTVLLALVGVLSLRLAQAWDLFPARHATPPRAAMVALLAAMAVAGAWEIFEFTMDELQGTREQDDLTDTMLDMIDGTVGGAIAAAWAVRSPRAGGRLATAHFMRRDRAIPRSRMDVYHHEWRHDRVKRSTVDLTPYPDLVIMYLGLSLRSPRGIFTILKFLRRIRRAVAAHPDGLLLHEIMFFPPFTFGMRQYWRDFDRLEAWAGAPPHRLWWREYLADAAGTGLWHETYFMQGGVEAIYDNVGRATGLTRFAEVIPAEGGLFNARMRARYAQRRDAWQDQHPEGRSK